MNRDHQNIAGGVDRYVVEQAAGIKPLNGFGRLFLGEGVAHPHRQITEDGARIDTLDAIDLDVFDHEREKACAKLDASKVVNKTGSARLANGSFRLNDILGVLGRLNGGRL